MYLPSDVYCLQEQVQKAQPVFLPPMPPAHFSQVLDDLNSIGWERQACLANAGINMHAFKPLMGKISRVISSFMVFVLEPLSFSNGVCCIVTMVPTLLS